MCASSGSFPSDIYQLADAFLKQDDITLLQRKDYIAAPKPNGYRSLHLIVETPIFLHDQKRMMRVEVPVPHHLHGLVGKP